MERNPERDSERLKPKVPLPTERSYMLPSAGGPTIIKDNPKLPSEKKVYLSNAGLNCALKSQAYREPVDSFESYADSRTSSLMEIRGLTSCAHVTVPEHRVPTIAEERASDAASKSSIVNNPKEFLTEGHALIDTLKFVVMGTGLLVVAWFLYKRFK